MKNDIEFVRHSLAHLLAAAILEIHPEALPTIGPAIDNGFYYDFDFEANADSRGTDAEKRGGISDKELPKIEKKMREILKTWDKFVEIDVSVDEAEKIYAHNKYKLELIKEIKEKGEKITLYYSGPKSGIPSSSSLSNVKGQMLNVGFLDLCRGGHAESAKEIKPDSFKLDRVAGAYWRGSEKNAMLTRIYGLAFATKQELDDYQTMMVEAEKRDHRKLGQLMNIFTFDDDVGPGLPLWMPNGTIIIEQLEKLARDTELAGDYKQVRTPHIAKESMYKKSGHLPYYEDTMFPPMEYEGGKYYLKAMNCPHHHKIFAAQTRSYRSLPLRLAEYGTVYRHEKSGELFGLMRVRMLSMNDAHIYCTEAQFADEFRAVNEMYLKYFEIFQVKKYVMRFSTHDPKRLGEKFVNEPELWKKTEDMVRKVLVDSKIPFIEVANEAAFYGPKIDVQVWSAIGREFTLATNQVDFAVPKRFDLTYTDSDGKAQTPLCIHRAPLGTHERFIGFLIEHFGGNFPLWLAPVQVKIIPIADNHHKEADLVYEMLKAEGVRAELALEGGFGKNVREAKVQRIPYFVIIGDKDIEAKKVTLESRDKGNLGQLSSKEVVEKLVKEIKEKK